jgi:Reverse transcriptase (RNA-dependent DNA polymerase)
LTFCHRFSSSSSILQSLSLGVIPKLLKAAYITPILKKPDLNLAKAKSYRPTSNLTVLSKLLERLVARQFLYYLKSSRLTPDQQSAYLANHSTETAIQKVLGDILRTVGSGQLALLTLLDLSAAFDTINHDTLLRRLHTSYGLGAAFMVGSHPTVRLPRFPEVDHSHHDVWSTSRFGTRSDSLSTLHC